ncbi:MAG: hypothetical protein KDN19_02635 [Verrucomicrobiae bacterium]|nr:hypothetical protein [Verrucomicrobiae bacterium]
MRSPFQRLAIRLLTVVVFTIMIVREGYGQAITMTPVVDPGTRPTPKVQKARPGPWGELEYWEIWLEPPTQLVLSAAYLSEKGEWRLPLMAPDEVRRYFLTNGLTEEQVDSLLVPERVREERDWIAIQPPIELIESFTPEFRNSFYTALGKWSFNRFQDKPFALGGDTVRSLADAGRHRIPQDVIDYADRLVYQRGGQNVLTDYPQVLQKMPAMQTRLELTKLLMRARSMMVRLRITPDSDLDQLRKYWSAGRRNRDVLPILNAVASTQDVEYLDIVHLLPPNPRKYLYAYARASMAVANDFPDCFWTSFNFLEPESSDRNLDYPVNRLVGTRWLEVKEPLRFGDMIIVEEIATGEAVHACTYIADDLVYSKNGLSLLRPFVIEDLSSVLNGYLLPGKTVARYYRHRDIVNEID